MLHDGFQRCRRKIPNSITKHNKKLLLIRYRNCTSEGVYFSSFGRIGIRRPPSGHDVSSVEASFLSLSFEDIGSESATAFDFFDSQNLTFGPLVMKARVQCDNPRKVSGRYIPAERRYARDTTKVILGRRYQYFIFVTGWTLVTVQPR